MQGLKGMAGDLSERTSTAPRCSPRLLGLFELENLHVELLARLPRLQASLHFVEKATKT